MRNAMTGLRPRHVATVHASQDASMAAAALCPSCRPTLCSLAVLHLKPLSNVAVLRIQSETE